MVNSDASRALTKVSTLLESRYQTNYPLTEVLYQALAVSDEPHLSLPAAGMPGLDALTP